MMRQSGSFYADKLSTSRSKPVSSHLKKQSHWTVVSPTCRLWQSEKLVQSSGSFPPVADTTAINYFGVMISRALILIVALATAWPANALCIYRGVDNARTTLNQEFRDSRWVVRARVVSADYHWSDEGESWTLYRLKVVQSFKGDLSNRFTFFTERNSGGFYMDGDGAVPNMDGDYLLFLTRFPRSTDPPATRGALWVNYNCGQSKPWAEVSSDDLRKLRKLSSRR